MDGVKMNMREKMAKAIYERWRRDFQDQKPWEETTEDNKGTFFPFADAVLDAMLEPTEEVIEAGWGQALDDKPGPIWQAMIDAIKAGK